MKISVGIGVLGLTCVLAAGACGDDDGQPSPTGGSSGSGATSTGGGSGSGGAAGSSAGGAAGSGAGGASGEGGSGSVACSGPGGGGDGYCCILTCSDGVVWPVTATVESSQKCSEIGKTFCQPASLTSCSYAPCT
jgi:hypothetical protein